MSVRKPVRARDIMQQTFAEVEGLTTVAQALTIMREQRVEVLIVKKRFDDDEYGIVLLADLAKKVLARDKAPERVNIYEIMSKPVISIDPQMDVRYCARLFDNFGLSVVPVMEDQRIVGIVSYSELVFRGL